MMYNVPPIFSYFMVCGLFICLILLMRECCKMRFDNITVHTIRENGHVQGDCDNQRQKLADSNEELTNNVQLAKQHDNVSVYIVFDARKK